MKKLCKHLLLLICLFALCSAKLSQSQINKTGVGSSLHLAIMETTDLHGHIRSYDYLKDQLDPNFGLEKTSTLIHQVRKSNPNNLLIDNGDTFEGTAMTDYQIFTKPLQCKDTLSTYKVMNYLNYDAGIIGNHEFNYGLETLSRVTSGQLHSSFVNKNSHKNCDGPKFPLITGNIFDINTNKTIFKPYIIVEKSFTVKTTNNTEQKVKFKVGVLGFTPPKILTWDKKHLDRKVYSSDSVVLARQYISEMKKQGVDLIIMASHSGLDRSNYTPEIENNGWYLSLIEDVDALLLGHSHQLFPGAEHPANQFKHEEVNANNGTVNGVPTLMPNFWGSHLGVIEMDLSFDGNKWVIDKNKSIVKNLPVKLAENTYVSSDPNIVKMTKKEHDEVVGYLNQAITSTQFPITSYFTDVGESSTPGVINAAQTEYVQKVIQSKYPNLANVPVTSMASSFRNGFAGLKDFTEIPVGRINRRSAMDLYVYPNTIAAVLVNGDELKNWLEKSAQRFKQIDPSLTSEQYLISNFPGYNFDMLTDPNFEYEIDVTQVTNQRIKNLKYKNKIITKDDQFIIATNNYRASGGGDIFPSNNKNTVFIDTMSNKDVVLNYLMSQKELVNPPHRSWKLTPFKPNGKILFDSKHETFESGPYLKGMNIELTPVKNAKTIYEVNFVN